MKAAEPVSPVSRPEPRAPAPAAREERGVPGGAGVHAVPSPGVAGGGAPPGLPPRAQAAPAVLRMQRTLGNAAVQRFLARRAAAEEGEVEAAPGVEDSIREARGGGAGLHGRVREEMESAFGADFGAVRVHTGGVADTLSRELGARAFTTGSDVFFREGEFSPGSREGRKLLAHELTHVVQQGGAAPRVQARLVVGAPDDEYEREADRVAEEVVQAPRGSAPPGAGDPPPAAAASSLPPGPAGRVVQRDEDAPAETGPVLAPDESFRWIGPESAPELVIRRSWLIASRVPSGTETISGKDHAGVLRPILSALVDRYPWAQANRAEVMESVGEVGISVADGHWSLEEMHCEVAHSIFQIIGLPPEAPVQVYPQGDGVEVYADLRTLYPRDAAREAVDAARTAVAERIVGRLEEVVGRAAASTVRGRAITFFAGRLPAARQTFVQLLSAEDLRAVFGAEGWDAHLAGRRERTGEGGGILAVPGGAFALPADLSAADRERVERLMREIYGSGGSGGQGNVRPLTSEDVRQLLAIDAHPARGTIIEMIRSSRGEGNLVRTQSVAELVQTAVAQIDRVRAAQAVGHELPEPTTDPDAPSPIAARPVRGRILNRSGALVPGMEGRFEFEVVDQVDALRVPHVSIDWYAVVQGAPPGSDPVDTERTNYIDVREDSIINDRDFGVTFQTPGIYEIHAFVNHNFYLPAHFVIPVQVLTEHERLLQQEESGPGLGTPGEPRPRRFQDVARENLMVGVGLGGGLGTVSVALGGVGESYAEGFRSVGTMSEEAFSAAGGSIGAGRAELQAQIEQLDRLLAQLRGEGTTLNADLLEWAQERRGRLQATLDRLTRLQGDAGTHPVACRGNYVTRMPGVRSGPLSLAAWFTYTPGPDGSGGTYHGHLFDHSELVRNEDFHFRESDESYERMMEKLFFALTRTYPNGTMSFAFQVYEGVAPTRSFIRYERVTDTLLNDVRNVLFSEAASVVINIGATVLSVFPPTAPIGIGISIAYNGASAALNFADASRTGTVRAANYLDLGMVALDVIPLLGRASRVVRMGTTSYHVLNATQYTGMAYMLTDGAFEQIRQLRDGQVTDLARLGEEIAHLERTNPSDPSLAEKRRRAQELRTSIRSAAAEVFVQQVSHQGITLAAQHAVGRAAQRPAGEGAPGGERPPPDVIERPAGEAARPLRPAGDAHLASRLPAGLEHVPVLRGPPPDAHAVEVHYRTDALGLVSEVYVRAGPAATPEHVAQHAQTIRLMERYSGLGGAVRVLFERMQALVARRGAVLPGTALWEAGLEVEKLPRIIRERAETLRQQGLDPGVRQRVEADLDFLRAELEHYRAVVEREVQAEGVGFVAARAPGAPSAPALPTFSRAQQRRIAHVWERLENLRMGWRDLGFADEAALVRFFREHPAVDDALTALEGRMDRAAALRATGPDAQPGGRPEAGEGAPRGARARPQDVLSTPVVAGASPAQVRAVQALLDRLRERGELTPQALRQLELHFRVTRDLDWSIRYLRNVETAEQLERALAQAFRRRAMQPAGGGPSVDPEAARATPGTAAGGERLPRVTSGAGWLREAGGSVGLIPGQIASRLRGRTFSTFRAFREAFWMEVAADPVLSADFSPANRELMARGLAPYGDSRFTLHHITPIEHGGAVYDLDNLAVVTGRYHHRIHD